MRKGQSSSVVVKLLEALGKEKLMRTLEQNNFEAARNIRKYKDRYYLRES